MIDEPQLKWKKKPEEGVGISAGNGDRKKEIIQDPKERSMSLLDERAKLAGRLKEIDRELEVINSGKKGIIEVKIG